MLSNIVNVTIARQTVTVAQASFDIPLILSSDANFAARVKSYSSLTELKADLVAGSGDVEDTLTYIMAAALFAQDPHPTTVKLGQRKTVKVLTDDAGTFTAGSIVVTVNGHEITQAFSTSKDDTLTALAAQIQALDEITTAAYSSGAHTITITGASGYIPSIDDIDLSGVTGTLAAIAISTTSAEDASDALDACILYDNAWYGLVLADRTEATILDVASSVDSNGTKIFFNASDDADIIDVTLASDSTSLPAVAKAAAYERAAMMYHSLADTESLDAGLMGVIFPKNPGSYTAKFKTVSGVTVDSLTTTQETNALAKYAGVYTEIGGRNMFQEGRVAEGEWIDTIIFIDWLKSRLKEAIFAVLANNDKVPYDDGGIAAIVGAMTEVFEQGIRYGGITSPVYNATTGVQTGGYVITVPKAADIASASKNARALPDIEFTAYLAGAIHAVTVAGIVTV